MGQWMAGFCTTMREETDQNSRNSMLDYLIGLLDDSNDFSWSSAKASHAMLLCRMEQGEIKDFIDTEKIDRVRCAHAQRHTFDDPYVNKNSSNHTHSKSRVCQYYNAGICSQQNSHEMKGVPYKHACPFCFAKSGKYFALIETNYRNKQK